MGEMLRIFLLVCCLYAVYLSSALPAPTYVNCTDRNIIVVANSSSGMKVLVEDTRTDSANSFLAVVQGCHVPFQCSHEPGSCNAVRVGSNFIAVPGNNTVVLVKSPEEWYTEALPDSMDCNPTNLFFNTEHQTLSMACVGVSNSLTDLHFLLYAIRDLDMGRPSFHLLITTSSPVSGENISGPIFVQNVRCMAPDWYVLVDNNALWYYHQNQNDPVRGPELRNCSEVSHLDYVGGKLFTVYCDKEDLTVVYDVCNGQWTYYYQTEKGRYYSCGSDRGGSDRGGSDRGVYYSNTSMLVVDSSGATLGRLNHSVGNITKALCNQNFFVAVSISGILYGALINGEALNLSPLPGICSTPSCALPSLDRHGLATLGENGDDIIIVDEVEGCQDLVLEKRQNTVRDGVFLPFISPSGYGGSHFCQCKTDSTTTPSEVSGQTTVTTDSSHDPRGRELSAGPIAGITIASFLILAGLVIALLSVVGLVWKFGPCRQSSPGSRNGSVGVPLQVSDRGEAYMAVDNPLPNPENISSTDTTKVQKKFEGKTEQRRNDLQQKVQAVSQR